jgi:hypothetical protein
MDGSMDLNKNMKRRSYSPGFSSTDYPEVVISKSNGSSVLNYYTGSTAPSNASSYHMSTSSIPPKSNPMYYPNNSTRSYM